MTATAQPNDSTHSSPQYRYKTHISFGTGLLAGAAVSTLVPWEALGAASPAARFACLAALGASFVTLRIFFSGTEVRKATSVLMVTIGGLLMSAGAKIVPGSLAFSPVAVGATCFLFGITLLLRERRLPKESRQHAVARLLEEFQADAEDGSDSEVQTTKSIERLQALQLLADAQAQESQKKFLAGR